MSIHRFLAWAVLAMVMVLEVAAADVPGLGPLGRARVGASAGGGGGGPEEALVQEFLRVPLDRRLATALGAAAEVGSGGGETNLIAGLRHAVLTGEWDRVEGLFKQLPAVSARGIYKVLLDEVQRPPGMGGPGAGPPPPGAPAPLPAWLPGDILALADLAPEGLTSEQALALGRGLGFALARSAVLKPVLDRLEAGTRVLGGKDPQRRELAAMVLIGAGNLEEAAVFLPSLEAARERKDARVLNLHATRLAAGPEPGGDRGLLAWELTQQVLSLTNVARVELEQALQRAVVLLPVLGRERAGAWLRGVFGVDGERTRQLLALVGSRVTTGFYGRLVEVRSRQLEVQRWVVEELSATPGVKLSAWRGVLNLLAMGWLQEAELVVTRPPGRVGGQQFDQFGNPMVFGGQPYQDPNQLPALPPGAVLASAPGGAWLGEVDGGLSMKVRSSVALLHMRNEEELKAVPILEGLAREHRGHALGLANELLRAWARNNDPLAGGPQINRGYPPYYNPYMPQPQGIPLTRAMQMRNLKELGELLGRLRVWAGEELDSSAVVGAFVGAHSLAEVFRWEDVERVFGPVPGLRPEVLVELIQTMRNRLGGVWRQPQVQQQVQTRRNDKEIDAEVRRGYEALARLAGEAVAARPGEWVLQVARGSILFDWAEFDYGKKGDLRTYVARREEAFKAFAAGAAVYGGVAVMGGPKSWSAGAYHTWFNALLGASDLAQLTRQQEPGTNQVARIREALAGLGGELSRAHFELFGQAVMAGLNSLKPELKPRYAKAALQVAGDAPSLGELKRLSEFYEDLLGEVRLRAELDGPSDVGHGVPFGVLVSIEHTEALGRESGGFGKYLQNASQTPGYYPNPYGTPPVNHRDDFEKRVRERLGEGFEVVSVTFADPREGARGVGRPGWRTTPYAHLLLKARDGGVDRIPALQLDMDFIDRRGQVILPVSSEPLAIDARGTRPPDRVYSGLEVEQILDERGYGAGRLVLEIKASAFGLVPELDRVLDLTVPGWVLTSTNPSIPAVVSLVTTTEVVAARSERAWHFQVTPKVEGVRPTQFRFPALRGVGATMVLKRLKDADLAEAGVEVTLPEVELGGGPLGWGYGVWLAVGLLVVGVGMGWMGWARRVRGEPGVEAGVADYSIPLELNAFSAVGLLRRLEQDGSVGLTAEERGRLSAQIREIEGHYFGREAVGLGMDLGKVVREWVGRVT